MDRMNNKHGVKADRCSGDVAFEYNNSVVREAIQMSLLKMESLKSLKLPLIVARNTKFPSERTRKPGNPSINHASFAKYCFCSFRTLQTDFGTLKTRCSPVKAAVPRIPPAEKNQTNPR